MKEVAAGRFTEEIFVHCLDYAAEALKSGRNPAAPVIGFLNSKDV